MNDRRLAPNADQLCQLMKLLDFRNLLAVLFTTWSADWQVVLEAVSKAWARLVGPKHSRHKLTQQTKNNNCMICLGSLKKFAPLRLYSVVVLCACGCSAWCVVVCVRLCVCLWFGCGLALGCAYCAGV
jgi:hypothetical protein